MQSKIDLFRVVGGKFQWHFDNGKKIYFELVENSSYPVTE